MTKQILTLRSKIDRVDDQILWLLNERARDVQKIGAIKRAHGIEVLDAGREAKILSRLSQRAKGPLPPETIVKIWQFLIERFRELEKENPTNAPTKKPSVSIVGLGLMGASLAEALKKKGYRVRGSDKNQPPFLRADIIVLATPVYAAMGFLKIHGKKLQSGTLVLDLCSTKNEIYKAARKSLPRGVSYVGGHPLAGKAESGAKNADSELFRGKPFVLVPLVSVYDKPKEKRQALALAQRLVQDIGARIFTMEAKEHDRMLAATSHLPQLAATALSLAVRDLMAGQKPVFGAGLLSMLRLARSNYAMWKDIAKSNAGEIDPALRHFEAVFRRLRKAVKRGNFKTEFAQASAFLAEIEKC